MYEVVKRQAANFRFGILDENGFELAKVVTEKDAEALTASMNLVEALVERFPGFVNQQDEINGGDLVEFIGLYVVFDSEGRARRKI
jgi:hypothetical protein